MLDQNLLGQEIQGYTVVKKLGSGGYGTVYLAEKEDLGKKYQTAIKHISLPDAEGYDSVLQDYGYNKAAAQAHFEKMVEGITAEINTLLGLSKKDSRYIVAYYDHEIQKSEEPLRFDILMRMEYLTPLNTHIRKKGITLGETVKLGLNMCDALSLCHSSGIIHRDMKEANIFVSENGNFKLGDFGVAKAAIDTTQAGSMKGTATYMAPEIYLREAYDSSVDVYSLGIVMYKLLNNLRLPFMPDAPTPFTVDDRNMAETRRLKGEVPPQPANAKNRLGEIVVKACSPKAGRYARAEEMKADLQAFLKTISGEEYDTVVIEPSLESEDPGTESATVYTQTQGATVTMGAQSSGTASIPAERNPYAKKDKQKKKKGKVKIVLLSIAVIAVTAAGIVLYLLYSNYTDPVNQFQTAIEESDFTEATQLYQDKIKGGDTEKLEEAAKLVRSRADEVKDQYISGEIDYEAALAQLQEMVKLGAVDSEELEPLIEEINELRTSRVAYENAQDHIASGEWQAAITELRKVIQEDSNYSQAQTKMADAIRSYKDDLLAAMAGFEADGNYEGAIQALQAGLQVVPDDADILTKISDYEKEIENRIQLEIDNIVREAKSTVSVSADYAGSLESLRAASKKYPKSEEIQSAIAEIEDEYLTKALAEAERLASEKGYAEAVASLNSALKILPGNVSIKEAIADYEAKYPTLLQQMVYFTGRELENAGQEKDNLQGMQTNVIDTEWNGEFDNTYKLQGKYVRITGVLYQPFSRRSDTHVKTLEIFGDGRLLYSASMSGGKEPISFEVDLRGVSDFEIKLDGESSYWDCHARLANVELHQ